MRYAGGTFASKLSWSSSGSSGRGGGGASISNLASAVCSVKSCGTCSDTPAAYQIIYSDYLHKPLHNDYLYHCNGSK